jgi:hypothetical protein
MALCGRISLSEERFLGSLFGGWLGHCLMLFDFGAIDFDT